MSAEIVGRNMPAFVTLDDLAEMIDADQHGHRYETSPEGVLTVVPPPDSDHALIATYLMVWLASGLPKDRILQVAGVQIKGSKGVGGRIPDLTVWSRRQARAVYLPTDDLQLVIEIVSTGSEGVDLLTKVNEYAAAGIPMYWTVARDDDQTVTMYVPGSGQTYRVAATMPLEWLLNTKPQDYIAA
ncbi:Uma2 family endonuclease [Actinoplanes sp. NPDC049265]|uniref:Uma2 family endonuclease n=1 Tax=Actinoplanes sp. NPDC049265 TaxID=3363902 RepID=UPI003723EBD1